MSSSPLPATNLVTVIRAFVDLVERADIGTIAQLVSADVVWQGLAPELHCAGRDQVLAQMTRGLTRAREFTAFSASSRGDEVAVSVEGPQLRDWFDPALQGSAHLVFTFANGFITSIRATRTREEAFSG